LDWKIVIPFWIPNGGVEAGTFCLAPEILILPKGCSTTFLAFLWELGSIGALRLQAQVLEALALDPVEGSSEDSTPGSRADIGLVGTGMLPSNPGMGKMRLSKFSIQEFGI
jgi:hypothetical protein